MNIYRESKRKDISLEKEIAFIKGEEELIEYIRQDMWTRYIDIFKDKEEVVKLDTNILGIGHYG